MKKINLLLIAISSVLLFSCEEDDGTSFVREDYLLGKWNVSQVGELSPQNIVNYTDYENCEIDNLIFAEGDSYTENIYNLENGECINKVVSGSYDRNGSNVTISYIKDNKTLNHVKKVLSLTYEEMEITYTDTITNKIVFKKLNKATE